MHIFTYSIKKFIYYIISIETNFKNNFKILSTTKKITYIEFTALYLVLSNQH